MTLRRDGINGAQIGRHYAQLLAFEPLNNVANETALDGVGLDHDESSIHDEPI
jgi:hypothetical protein